MGLLSHSQNVTWKLHTSSAINVTSIIKAVPASESVLEEGCFLVLFFDDATGNAFP